MLEFFHVENAFTAKSSVVLAFLVSWTPNWLTAVSEFPKEIMKIPKILGKETVEILNWVNRFSENACNKINMVSWSEEGGKICFRNERQGKKEKGREDLQNWSLLCSLTVFCFRDSCKLLLKGGLCWVSCCCGESTALESPLNASRSLWP